MDKNRTPRLVTGYDGHKESDEIFLKEPTIKVALDKTLGVTLTRIILSNTCLGIITIS